ncbi:hypothetical protein [Novosphingobium sp.]|uniref:hypothetical protein n=1 Tax=Novosphingobium sp. TaxID=1874826 RepID=UPI0035AEF734
MKQSDLTSDGAGRAGLACASARPGRRTSGSAFADLPPAPDDPLLGFAPYVHRAPRRNSITPERQRAFIAALAATGIVTQAARSIGASLEALYRLRHQPGAEQFSEAWDRAIDRGIARLEDCALERAIMGEERPIVRGGEVIGTWRRHDNKLLMFLLRQRRPQRWFSEAGAFASLRPGHPVYERLRREWLGEDGQSEAEVLAEIDAMIMEMAERKDENERLLAGWAAEDAGAVEAD